MSAKAKPRRKRKRKLERRAAIRPYVAELKRSRVPPLVAAQAGALMMILLGAEKDRRQG
jgi:hypothetical protein